MLHFILDLCKNWTRINSLYILFIEYDTWYKFALHSFLFFTTFIKVVPVKILLLSTKSSTLSLTEGQISAMQVRHRTRTWRHGKWCGTCRTVTDWRGLRTAEASCSEWYPDVGTPILTAGRSSRLWGEIWRSYSRTIWTDIT